MWIIIIVVVISISAGMLLPFTVPLVEAAPSTTSMPSLAILNGVVVNEDGERAADVYIRGGTIESVVDREDPAGAAAAMAAAAVAAGPAWRVIDAAGKYVMVRVSAAQ